MARLSPARRHFLRATAAVAAARGVQDGPAGARGEPATAYELQCAELDGDLRALKQIQGLDLKLARKREIIGKYDPWVAGVIDAARQGARPAQDEVLLRQMIWALDIEDYDRALPLVDFVLRHGLALPDRFSRTAATLIAEISADAALTHIGQDRDANLDWLQVIEEATRDHDMVDQVRAKLHKALGLSFARIFDRQSDPETADPNGAATRAAAALAEAIRHLREALRLNAKVGVKKEIERLDRAAAKAANSPQP